MKTRFTEETGIKIKKFGRDHWQHVCRDGVQVGPVYLTKTEILADHESYLERAGWR